MSKKSFDKQKLTMRLSLHLKTTNGGQYIYRVFYDGHEIGQSSSGRGYNNFDMDDVTYDMTNDARRIEAMAAIEKKVNSLISEGVIK